MELEAVFGYPDMRVYPKEKFLENTSDTEKVCGARSIHVP